MAYDGHRLGNNLPGRGFFGRYKIIDVVSNMNQYVSSGKFRKLGNIPECKLIDWLIDWLLLYAKQAVFQLFSGREQDQHYI